MAYYRVHAWCSSYSWHCNLKRGLFFEHFQQSRVKACFYMPLLIPRRNPLQGLFLGRTGRIWQVKYAMGARCLSCYQPLWAMAAPLKEGVVSFKENYKTPQEPAVFVPAILQLWANHSKPRHLLTIRDKAITSKKQNIIFTLSCVSPSSVRLLAVCSFAAWETHTELKLVAADE